MKAAFKRFAQWFALVAVLPPLLAYRLAATILGPTKAFAGWSQAFSLLPGLTGEYLRAAFYRFALREFGENARITFGTIFSHPTATVGRNVYVGAFCALGDVALERDVLIGSHVSIANGKAQHGIDRLDLPIREQPGVWSRVTIGEDSWIGDRAVVLADVGRHCVIGAGTVVTRPIPDYAIAAGVPARVIRFRNAADASIVSAHRGNNALKDSPANQMQSDRCAASRE